MDRAACRRIEDMVIDCPIFFISICDEIALITARRNDRSVIFLNRGDDFIGSAEWSLDADSIR